MCRKSPPFAPVEAEAGTSSCTGEDLRQIERGVAVSDPTYMEPEVRELEGGNSIQFQKNIAYSTHIQHFQLQKNISYGTHI